MDKLKPILAYKFWILLGLGLIVMTAGWFMGTGTLAETIDSRRSTLEAITVKPGSGTPSNDWIGGIDEVAAVQSARLQEAGGNLWKVQEDQMTWPQDIEAAMRGIPVGGEIPVAALDLYRTNFEVEKNRLHETVNPFNPITGQGEVIFGRSLIPLNAPTEWNQFLPTSGQVWALQEDYWLIRSLLESIRDFNNSFGGNSLRKVRLKRIVALELHGGGEGSALPSAAEGGSMEAPPTESFVPEEYQDDSPFGGAGRGTRDNRSAGPVDFDPAEEFRGTGSAAGAGADGRYVTNAPDVPFKTRGFYLKVIVDHRYVPELLIELTENPYPVKIVRVHQQDHNGSVYAKNTQSQSRFGGRGNTLGTGAAGNQASAFAEPFLADVTIAGDLTIYRQPEQTEADPAEVDPTVNPDIPPTDPPETAVEPSDSPTPAPGDVPDEADGSLTPMPAVNSASEQLDVPMPPTDEEGLGNETDLPATGDAPPVAPEAPVNSDLPDGT
ncbi:hypothetical protein [Stratiformator vulcanicus]|uniref:Uncharacterized protein n=1 Tax=Stratiformator vulcanicus TaxID=2527980 RepID=A0A517R074_9PLAN|nr:hypothetical protein [Stratiformator vulcanicus]QDT37268.1 hypothetical protein Pan189_16410 [Stratiformator vulcanicus]